ncbi:PAS domain-containing protein [Synoicihabitans lomoniglobus]|uniref:histidine kinase n=1 Tax=Synoicihabitans lomoniglobus TaxID=2909285 RepID=A0AAE9ZWL4_9BACT|nr:PAS domain-containing protein [Opitutaceae bacterium LMO-M01]WED64225.1 PAS domain-containing protein [Opitutaceae bacterium LMO-M01]
MSPASGQETPTVTSLADYWSLGTGGGDQEFPLRTQIDVFYYDSDWNVMWADWGGTGCYISPGTKPLPLKSGQRIELDGFVIPGQQKILWERTTIRVVQDVAPFKAVPLPVPLSRFMEFNLRLVTVEGLVCEQSELDSTHTRLTVVSPDWQLTTQVYVRPDSPIPQLRGAFVRMRGVFSVKEDIAKQSSDLEMWVSDIEDIEVTSWLAEDDRFDLPSTPVEKLAEAPGDELARIEGAVHAVDSGASITLRSDTGEVRVMTRQTRAAELGEMVEAVGYPEIGGVESRLLRGLVRILPEVGKSTEPSGGIASPKMKFRLTDQIRHLNPADARRGYLADVRGVVTWSDPELGSFFLLDSSGGIEVHLPSDGSIPAPAFGMDVIVEGQVQSGNFVPAVQATGLRPAMGRTLPSPKPLTFDQAMTGFNYGGWTEFRGYVHAVAREFGDLTRISLTTSAGDLVLLVRGFPPERPLVGALISARGVCDAIVNDRRELTGVRLLVSAPDLIEVEERAPADIFSMPLRSIGSLLQFGGTGDRDRRVRISGVVALHHPGTFFYLVDGDDRLLVLSRQSGVLQPGDRVEAVGIPGNEAGRLVIRNAVYRRLGSGPAPVARTLEHSESPKLEWEGMTVRLQGKLLSKSDYPDFTRLQLQQRNAIFEAQMPGIGEDPLVVGSLLEVTGIYRVQLDEYRQPRSFSIELRTPDDMRVLARPPWWSSTQVLWVSGALLLAMLMTAGWGMSLAHKNRLLRDADRELQEANTELENRVVERTRDLQSEVSQRRASEDALAGERRLLRTLIDNLPVYLYVKNTKGRFVIGNLPHSQLLGGDSDASVVDKSDYDLYPAELAERYEKDDIRVIETGEPLHQHEEPSCAHGQPGWFSTTKVPVRDTQGRIAGLIGISLDITERKKVEEAHNELQRQLINSSRQAGMAEVATGVLHNVGNVLNSVNISASIVRQTLRNSELKSLDRVAAMLRDHDDDMGRFLTTDPKGRILPGFIVKLSDQLAKEHGIMRDEHQNLEQNIEHIKEIVAMQQNYATVSGVTEKMMLADLIDDALKLHAASFQRHGVEIVRDYADLPPVILDKHKVMQIVVNLIVNAKHAVDEANSNGGRITATIRGSVPDRIQLSISDDGVGISPENLTRLFSHGFTTRPNGHGFGLHNGANAARELGGSLTVESPGLGLGATFTLDLPIVPAGSSGAD